MYDFLFFLLSIPLLNLFTVDAFQLTGCSKCFQNYSQIKCLWFCIYFFENVIPKIDILRKDCLQNIFMGVVQMFVSIALDTDEIWSGWINFLTSQLISHRDLVINNSPQILFSHDIYIKIFFTIVFLQPCINNFKHLQNNNILFNFRFYFL